MGFQWQGFFAAQSSMSAMLISHMVICAHRLITAAVPPCPGCRETWRSWAPRAAASGASEAAGAAAEAGWHAAWSTRQGGPGAWLAGPLGGAAIVVPLVVGKLGRAWWGGAGCVRRNACPMNALDATAWR